MGTPAKELWIDRHFRATGVPVSMGVGGSFDVIAGEVKRAPRWIQDAGLEWFYRFAQEPTRLFHRYFVVSLQFFFKVLAARFRPSAVERP
jgi:N-acetylglucosaminyldiphosphoundecaprenol N-acetyl-beta-D-mannosaminyltransferase